jgi:diadenosine tetraphosphate (Ap4A) HIT family hydrolase
VEIEARAAFAGLWVCASFHFLPREAALPTLKGFARILQSGGVLCLSVELEERTGGEVSRPDDGGIYRQRYTVDELMGLLRNAGFRSLGQESSQSCKSTVGPPRVKTWLTVFAQNTGTSHLPGETADEPRCSLCIEGNEENYKAIGFHKSASILWGDDRLFVMPDIAPLAEGHLLIVSTSHFRSFGALPAAALSCLEVTKRTVRDLLKQAYGKPTIFFEHGSARPGEAGACVDHAHLHCLPCSLPLKDILDRRLGPGIRTDLASLRYMYQTAQSYLYLEEGPGDQWVYPVDVLPCQFHRRALAELMGDIDWDWRRTRSSPETRANFLRTLEQLLPLVDDYIRQETTWNGR